MNISQNDRTNNIALNMDTNNVIDLIYNSIPKKNKYFYHWIKDVDDAGNPLYYYENIMQYLGNNSIHVAKTRSPTIIQDILFNTPHNIIPKIPQLGINVDKLGNITNAPDIFVISLYDADNNDVNNLKSTITNKPLEFTLVSSSQTIKYVLDSAIIRDSSKSHFASVLTCNGAEKTFDGASISRLSDLNWKSLLNQDHDWTYKYNLDGYSDFRWNFCKCYQMLFYYRTN